MNDYQIFIPENNEISESGYFEWNELVNLLKKYKNDSNAIQFIAEMME